MWRSEKKIPPQDPGTKRRNLGHPQFLFPDEIVNFNDSVRVHSALFVKVELDKDTSLRKADERRSINLPVRAAKLLGIPCIQDVVSIHKTTNGRFVGSWCQPLSDSRLDILYPYEAHAMNE